MDTKIFKRNELSELSTDAQKLLLEQAEKKYNLLLTDDQSIRTRIQSVNAISIGLIVLLVSIIHNKDWNDYANNYFIALVIFLFYNAIIFFLTFILRHKIGNWSAEEIIKSVPAENIENDSLSQIYLSRILYYEQESYKLIRSTRLMRFIFLFVTIVAGIAIIGFYYFTYWI